MSDRVTNAEVEDVLSSIRRLVSDDNRPGQAPKAGAPNTRPKSARPVTERLVLTPALRVTEPTSEQPKDGKAGDADAADREPLVLSADTSVKNDQPVDASLERTSLAAKHANQTREQIAAALAEDYSADPYDFDDNGEIGADKPIPKDRELDHERSSDLEEPADKPHQHAGSDTIVNEEVDVTKPTVEMISPNQTQPDVQPDADAKAAALNAKIAALETAIGKISDTWEPDDLGQSDYAGTAGQEMTWEEDEVEPKPFYRPTLAPVMRKVQDPDAAEDVSVAKTAEGAPSKEAELATQEFFTTRKSPPKPVGPTVAETPSEPVQPVKEPAVQKPNVEQAAKPDADAALPTNETVFAEGDQLLDEDALREMIGEIVRSELQGALGERITRNVRKLVRREIHRALTAQELE